MPFLIILVILIVILSLYLKNPQTRGKIGETKVGWAIGKTRENQQYVINDLIVLNNEMSSQIDHIVINPRGIFVIETKNYSGVIYGNENQREWTQVLAYGKVKNKLYNPLKQNATHVYNVKKIIGNLPVYSLVVFVQNNTRHIEANNFIPLSALKTALNYGESVLSIDQMKTAYNALLESRAEITTQDHVNNIRDQQHNLSSGICPRCGGTLVERNGKYGIFLGCSNYPQCRFIKK